MIFTDLNPPLLMLFYYPLGIRGVGLEFGYARDLPRGFAVMGDVSFITLTQWDANFSVWDLALCGRYGVAKTRAATVFVSTKAGALLYASPYYRGAAFVTGLEISTRFGAGAHFIIEPYAACNVYTADRSLMPFVMEAPTELLVPGFKLGARFGAIF
jgi:hypothetical protein